MQKNIFKFLALFLTLIIVFFFLRKFQNKANNLSEIQVEDIAYEATLPEDFHKFYDKFHTDSIFQLERTVFPLKGMAKASDSTMVAEEIMWQKVNWKRHKPFNDQNGTFERVFTNIGGIISEQISANKGLFSLEKRYAKLNGGWHLIYYQELLMNG